MERPVHIGQLKEGSVKRLAKRNGKLLFVTAIVWMCAATAVGQSTSGVFTPGNLVVTRSVYTGDATTIAVGQFLPPICPATAACGPIKASDNGAYPTPGSTNNVWNNAKADGNFGLTSPILLDQITPSGSLVNTLVLPGNMMATSFASKSELALNLSPDGTALTLMGYLAPLNTPDVSNSNSPGVYDPTNPAGGSYFRGIAQIGANGAIQITPVSSYSGDTGRAAILANGLYYMVGNANNGTGTPANLIASTGVQVAVPGQAAGTPPIQAGYFSIEQVNNPATGKPYPPDKAGKDDNFRGLTVFNNTLYVTKGSGSNGINTIYQVGRTGSLPALATAAGTPLTILPGFPTSLARSAGAAAYFGLWFASATTLYVADEGDGTTANAASSKVAGLQKWSQINGTWQLDYVLQNGLNLGQPYSIPNYPATLNPATDGLRNITGRVNADGTATIWAITSTISTNGDQGADPNKLVAITDVVANLNPGAAANEQFITVKTAQAGEVLRGVAFAPTPAATPMANVPLIMSAANPAAVAIAPGSLAFAFGQGLATGNPGQILGVFPFTFAGTSVTIADSAGAHWAAPLLFVSPAQVTFLVPSGIAAGLAKVTVTSGSGNQTAPNIQIAPVAPGLFTINNAGLAAGYVVRLSANGSQSLQQLYVFNTTGTILANPIDMGSPTDKVYLALFGTGWQAAPANTAKATVAGTTVPVLYLGTQGSYPGLDQVNIPLPSALAGQGNTNIQFSAGGASANAVQISIH